MTKKYKITQTMIDYETSIWEVEANTETEAKKIFERMGFGSNPGIKMLRSSQDGETKISVKEVV